LLHHVLLAPPVLPPVPLATELPLPAGPVSKSVGGVGAATARADDSIVHVAEHQSPETVFPSSHCSLKLIIPLPHTLKLPPHQREGALDPQPHPPLAHPHAVVPPSFSPPDVSPQVFVHVPLSPVVVLFHVVLSPVAAPPVVFSPVVEPPVVDPHVSPQPLPHSGAVSLQSGVPFSLLSTSDTPQPHTPGNVLLASFRH